MTTSSITISWTTLPSDAVNGVLLGYQMIVKSTQDSAVNANISTSSFPLHSFHNLNSNTGYSISISAFNSAGLGPSCIAAGQTLPKGIASVYKNVYYVQCSLSSSMFSLVRPDCCQPIDYLCKYFYSHPNLDGKDRMQCMSGLYQMPYRPQWPVSHYVKEEIH